MKLAEILKELQDEQGAIPADRVDSLVEKMKEHNQGLVNNKEKLLSEKKKADEEKRKLEEKIQLYEGIDPEKVKKLEKEYEELSEQVNLKENDAVSIKKALTEKYEKEKQEIMEQLEEFKGKYTEKTVSETLSQQLEKAGVTKPTYKKAVMNMLKNKTKVVDDAVLVGDKTADEYIKEWSETDEAKDFISAEKTTGGGAKTPGGNKEQNNVDDSALRKAAGLPTN